MPPAAFCLPWGEPPVRQGAVGLLASTQFQFQDIGVNLDLTPHLLSTGEIAVHAKIEISSLGASISVGGITEPTFGQRVIEDDFRLQEGEVNLLGGLIQRTLTDQVQGIPGLGDIPGLRYLFSQDNKEVNDQEVLVMLTPRVIRLPEPAMTEGSAVPVGSLGGGEGAPRSHRGPTSLRGSSHSAPTALRPAKAAVSGTALVADRSADHHYFGAR